MPIKFRCQKCRQYLGISRTQAGQIVDCPTCGRSVRVPRLDGKVEPLPAPAMDMDDSSLVDALDALAGIGHQPPSSDEDAVADGDAGAAGDQPTVIEVAESVAVPIELPPTSNPEVIELHTETVELPPAPQDTALESVESMRAATPQAGAPGFEATIAELAEMAPPPPSPTAGSAHTRRWYLAIVAVGIAMFAAGYFLRPDVGDAVPAERLPAESAAAIAPPPSADGTPAMRGRITYQAADGQRQPDRGARILVFAQEHPGVVTVSAIGLRSPVDGPDFRLTHAGWKSLGGDLAVADSAGEFQVQLPGPGQYPVLVISHFVSRPSDGNIPQDLEQLLRQYVDRPDQLLGRLQYHFETVRYQGSGTLAWDHTFR